MGIGDWGLGIGDLGLGIGPNPQSPIPNPHPQSPIPINFFMGNIITVFIKIINLYWIIYKYINKNIYNKEKIYVLNISFYQFIISIIHIFHLENYKKQKLKWWIEHKILDFYLICLIIILFIIRIFSQNFKNFTFTFTNFTSFIIFNLFIFVFMIN